VSVWVLVVVAYFNVFFSFLLKELRKLAEIINRHMQNGVTNLVQMLLTV
jgi:hypothetical protein